MPLFCWLMCSLFVVLCPAKNFVEIIALNKDILSEERAASLSRLRLLKKSLGTDGLKIYLSEEPLNIDFCRLTEEELGVILS